MLTLKKRRHPNWADGRSNSRCRECAAGPWLTNTRFFMKTKPLKKSIYMVSAFLCVAPIFLVSAGEVIPLYPGSIPNSIPHSVKEVVEERIIAVAFNADGIVNTIEHLDGDRQNIPYARTKTPTHGNDLTFMQQLLGNLGRFNSSSDSKKVTIP